MRSGGGRRRAAKRPAPAPASVLVVSVGDRRIAIPARRIVEVAGIAGHTPLPCEDPANLGVVVHRDALIPLIDLAPRLGCASLRLTEGGSTAPRLGFASVAAIAAALVLGACGTEGIEVADDDPNYDGAVLFSERCSGCHTMDVVGAQGSANRTLRNQGPNLDERTESVEDVLYAIRNGGFSGAIMPQNILVGDEAQAVAEFVAEYAGSQVDRPASP